MIAFITGLVVGLVAGFLFTKNNKKKVAKIDEIAKKAVKEVKSKVR